MGDFKPVLVENKNQKRYRVYGIGPKGLAIVWQLASDNVELVDPEQHEWLAIATYS